MGLFYGPINTTSEASMATWNEFRLFLAELVIKPKKPLALFNKNQPAISKKGWHLNDNIPNQYNKPQIKVEFRL
jgi:hypothetical protein